MYKNCLMSSSIRLCVCIAIFYLIIDKDIFAYHGADVACTWPRVRKWSIRVTISHRIDDESLDRTEITKLFPCEEMINSLMDDFFSITMKRDRQCLVLMTPKRNNTLQSRMEDRFPIFTHHPIWSWSVDSDHHSTIAKDTIDLLEQILSRLTIRDMMETGDTDDDIHALALLFLHVSDHIMLDSVVVRMFFFGHFQ